MSLPYNRDMIPRARELRKDATKEERRLWFVFLRTYPIRFQRQKTIGSFIADFYCHQAKLVIELDDSQHYTEQGIVYDRERDAVLRGHGLQVLRFSNADVAEHFEAVCETIHRTVQSRL